MVQTRSMKVCLAGTHLRLTSLHLNYHEHYAHYLGGRGTVQECKASLCYINTEPVSERKQNK